MAGGATRALCTTTDQPSNTAQLCCTSNYNSNNHGKNARKIFSVRINVTIILCGKAILGVDWFKQNLEAREHQPPFITEGGFWWCAIGENVGIEVTGKSKDFTP